MKNAKFVMFLYALSAIISMIGIGVSVCIVGVIGKDYNVIGWIGIIVFIIAMCVIFMQAFKTKKKFHQKGLL